MTEDNKTLTMRLAFREEGIWVNAYLAPADSMNDAILIGSMAKRILDASPDAWAGWRVLMTKAMEVFIQATTGSVATFGRETPAPEHEKSGHA